MNCTGISTMTNGMLDKDMEVVQAPKLLSGLDVCGETYKYRLVAKNNGEPKLTG